MLYFMCFVGSVLEQNVVISFQIKTRKKTCQWWSWVGPFRINLSFLGITWWMSICYKIIQHIISYGMYIL